MYRVTAYYKNEKISKTFDCRYDAIEYKDNADAHYVTGIKMEEEFNMRESIYNSWNSIMNMDVNPLKHIPDLKIIDRLFLAV